MGPKKRKKRNRLNEKIKRLDKQVELKKPGLFIVDSMTKLCGENLEQQVEFAEIIKEYASGEAVPGLIFPIRGFEACKNNG